MNEWKNAFYNWRHMTRHPEDYNEEEDLDRAEKYFTKFHEAFEIAQKIRDIHGLTSSMRNQE